MLENASTFSLRRAVLVLCLLLAAACASHGATFIHPQTGATLECSGSGFGLGTAWVQDHIDNCIRRSKNRGYVSVDQLTPQQRIDLEKRGLLPEN
ncbi:MAG: hypothetical protein OEN50_02200 [Deltaproteobacteria bacterium]|nr:hypothetical protein [Deltaproteobacteria bacterium]